MKKHQLTNEQLLSTGILDDFLNHVKKNSKKEQTKLIINDCGSRIRAGINYLMNKKKMIDPALEYLRSLEKDKNKLSRLKNRHGAEEITKSIDIKIVVGTEYCRKFRKAPTKNLEMDLFFLTLDVKTLSRLKHTQRLDILANIYLIMKNPPDKFDGWKKQYEDYFINRMDTIKKRIQRIPSSFREYLRSKEYKEFVKKRVSMLRENIKDAKGRGEKINSQLKTPQKMKRYIKRIELIELMQKEIKKIEKQFDRINLIELSRIIYSKNFKNPEKIYEDLTNDYEFLQAFFLPNLNE